MSITNVNCIKGTFSIFVLLHHLYQGSRIFYGTWLGIVLQAMGYLSVTIFFFLSGYGLKISYNVKGGEYVKAIPQKRMLALYIQCIVLIILYTILNVLIGVDVSGSIILQSLTWGNTIIINGWYLQTIMVLYLFFYWVYGFGLKNENITYIVLFFLLVVYILLNVLLGMPITRYQSIFSFLLGILWCDNKAKIDEYILRRWILSIVVVFMFFCGAFVAGVLIKPITILTSLIFCILVMLILMKVSLNCGFIRVLGNYFFEIYVMQGIGLSLFHSKILYVENIYIYISACILTTCILAVIIRPLFQYIDKFVKKR